MTAGPTCDGVLREENAADGNIRWGRTFAPSLVPVDPGAVVERGKDLLRGAMGWGTGDNGDSDREDARRVEDDAGVVEVAQDAHPEAVHRYVRRQQGGVDSKRPTRRRSIICLDSGESRYQACTAERDASSDGEL